MSELLQTADDLDAAADYLDLHGWGQQRLLSEGKVCARAALVGAIAGEAVLAQYARSPCVVLTAEQRLRLSFASSRLVLHLGGLTLANTASISGSIHLWNDHPGRTREEVTDTLRRCAKQLREIAGLPLATQNHPKET